MQILKTSLVLWVTVGCVGSISLAGEDTASQAQAREALRQKISELDAQGSTAETPSPKPPKVQKTAPVASPPPAVRKRPMTSPSSSPQAVKPAPAPAPAVSAPPAVAPRAEALPPTLSSEEAARLREALRQKIAELDAQEKAGQPSPAPTMAAPVVSKPAETTANVVEAEKKRAAMKKPEDTKARPASVAKAGTFSAIQPPPSAVPASKEGRLAELLRQYKTDAITPAQYHHERAKILAEP